MIKNIKEQVKQQTEEIRYVGYFLMEGGLKVKFDISQEDGGTEFEELYNNDIIFWEKSDFIWLGEESELKVIADKIIAWDIREKIIN